MKKRKQGGFTLVEISVVMLIVGLMVASAMQLYGTYIVQSRIEQTEVNRKLVALSLDEFKRRYGRYPCPARLDAKRADPDYGKEGNCADVSVAPGSCLNGVCIEESERQISLDGGVTNITPRVRRGGLPFRDMFLAEGVTYDKYHGRFNYAVTEILTDSDTFDVSRGGISVVDNQEPVAQPLVEPVGSALYFVFSSGPDNFGAYDAQGQIIHDCNGTQHDNENCNTSLVHAKAIYRSAPASTVLVDTANAGVVVPGTPPTVGANTHYDDFASYVSNEEQPMWKYSEIPGNETNVHDLLKPTQVLEIGTPTPPADTTNLKVDVQGDARAETKASAEKLCDQDKGNCMQAYQIGGTGMTECHEPTIVPGTGVGGNQIKCGSLATMVVDCAPGEFMTGIDTDGQPICGVIVKPKDCPAATKTLCTGAVKVTKTLPASPSGTVITITAGASASQIWTCKNGSWKSSTQTGVCTCTAGAVTSGPQACGTGFGGNVFTTTTTTVCPAGTTTTTSTQATACVCVPFTETRNQACTGNLTGAIAQTRAWTCVNNVPKAGAWTNVPGGNTCVCALPANDVQVDQCPNELVGTIITRTTLNTTSCTYGNPVVQNNCNCPSKDPQTRDAGCPAPTTGTYQQQRTFQCPAGTWTGWTDLPNSKTTNCKCINRDETRHVDSCTAPDTGGHTEKRTVDCSGVPVAGTAGQWTMVPGSKSCISPPPPPVCTWSATASAVGPVGTNSSPKSGSVCSCGAADSICYVGVGGSFFQGYNCKCGQ